MRTTCGYCLVLSVMLTYSEIKSTSSNNVASVNYTTSDLSEIQLETNQTTDDDTHIQGGASMQCCRRLGVQEDCISICHEDEDLRLFRGGMHCRLKYEPHYDHCVDKAEFDPSRRNIWDKMSARGSATQDVGDDKNSASRRPHCSISVAVWLLLGCLASRVVTVVTQ